MCPMGLQDFSFQEVSNPGESHQVVGCRPAGKRSRRRPIGPPERRSPVARSERGRWAPPCLVPPAIEN